MSAIIRSIVCVLILFVPSVHAQQDPVPAIEPLTQEKLFLEIGQLHQQIKSLQAYIATLQALIRTQDLKIKSASQPAAAPPAKTP